MSSIAPVSTAPPAPAPGRRRLDYKWIALSVTTIGAMMAAIDSTIVILALPDMMAELRADLIEMIRVIIGCVLVSTVLLLTFGRVADLLGRVRMYNLRQTGMVISLALSLAVAAGSLPRDVRMEIFIGTNVTLGSQVMQNFVVGIRNAFLFSILLCLIAAALSFARGKENRNAVTAREDRPR